MDNDDQNQLEFILQYPFNNLNFKEIAEILSNIADPDERITVLPVNFSNPKLNASIELLKKIIENSVNILNYQKQFPKEIRKIGSFISKELISDLESDPKIEMGKGSNVGYPKMQMTIDNEDFYLTLKTSVINNPGTLRFFYLSPGDKIGSLRGIGYHLTLFFYIANDFSKIESWNLYDLSELPLHIKFEFNASRDNLLQLKPL